MECHDPIARELRELESVALAVETGRLPSAAQFEIRSLNATLEALPLARQWKAQGVAPGFLVNSAAVSALKHGEDRFDAATRDRYRFVRALTPDAQALTVEAFWLELRKALGSWGVADANCANALVGACREMHDNILQHSGRPETGFCGFRAGASEFEVGVVDSGVGLTAAFLESNPGVSVESIVLLEDAVLHGKSRLRDEGRGTGFATLLRALRRLDASVRVRSDAVSLTLIAQGGAEYHADLKQEAQLSGFVVCARLGRIA